MKKIIATTTLVAALAAVTAQAVESANIVGYSKTTTPAAGAFDVVSFSQFTDGSTNGIVNIQDLISNIDVLNADGLGSNAAGADKLYLWNGAGYDTYAVFQDGATGPYWASVLEPGWALNFLTVSAANVEVNRGVGAWIETASGGASADAITSGEVPMDATFDVDVATGFSIISYPYTSAVNLSAMTVANASSAGLGSNAVGADKIYLWNGAGYDTYALFQDGATGPYWASVLEPGWALNFLTVSPANVVVDIGTGFWYESDADKTITFSTNY